MLWADHKNLRSTHRTTCAVPSPAVTQQNTNRWSRDPI